ncbi:PREDICTED: shugoshin-1-like [Camelina sativa]|uniref:Shugoshin-1-like n=1 Tax=Camelina sativa TaxID=90675 RepID=A0ABM0Y3Z2_CAMSA|nr:PREDICTED: shugoshin-1-like [Camelina sativa]
MVLTELSLDYSNRGLGSQKDPVKEMNREEMQQKENMLFSSQEFAQKLQKENMTLMKALAHRNKIVELSGIEFQKLRINLRSVQEKNLQLAQANSQMLAELNTSRDRLKELQHELGCKNALLKVKKQLEEQTLPRTDHASKDKVLVNASDGDCKTFQVHDMNQKDTKRKRTSRIKHVVANSEWTVVYCNDTFSASNRLSRQCTRRQSTRFDVQETEPTEKLLEMDAPKETNETARLSRQCTRRQSTRFDVQETEPTEKLLEMDAPKETNETARLSLRRRSARLRPEEAEPCKSFNEGIKVMETTKRRRLSSIQRSARFDIQVPEVSDSETLNADDARSLVIEESLGSRSEAVEEPSESRGDTKETNQKRRVSTRRQSRMVKSQTDEAIKEIATDQSLDNNIVQECDHQTESKDKPKADEHEGMTRRSSVGRPSRHAAEKVQSYREVSRKVKLRRQC